jgi:2-polyprenyl-3-methyl-5-hydroxy-6-metoxy-1,4-benzoquinol methylase
MSKPNRIDQTNQVNQVSPSRQAHSTVLRSLATKDPVAAPPQSSQSSSLGQSAMLKKQAIRERFDRLASERESWQQRASYYYNDQRRYLRFLVPEGLSVLEIGCGLGDQLAALKPRRGVGIDLSEVMVKEASKRHPDLEFLVGDGEALALEETFDVILLVDLVGHVLDVEATLKQLRRCCTPTTRVVIAYYSFLWEPFLRLLEKVGLKMPQDEQNWLSPADIRNLIRLADYEVVKAERRLLMPMGIPILSTIANRLLAYLPGLNPLCLSHYVVARMRAAPTHELQTVSIVIPCRNEKGNIEAAMARLPSFGRRQEVIFVDGHSTDGTPDEIQRVMAQHPEKDITLLVQDGKGKGDAVRKGFAHATGDILMILDADLTVPPEDLPKFYEAIASGKGEFINGSRLVYPMEHEAMRYLNLLGNKFFSMMFSWLLGERIKDTLCGTKVLFRRDYERIAANRSYFGEFDPFGDFDLLFGASKLNLKILEVPIRYQERTYGATNIHRFTHGWLLLKMTVYGFFRLKAV